MRYHNILKENMVNGDGMRAVLFVSGCTHHCLECQNPITWNKNDGLVFDDAAKAELFAELEKSHVAGITFSGGDPLAIYNREEVLDLIKEIKEKFPDKTVWVYSGWTKDELEQQGFWKDFSSVIDVFIEGKFEIQNRSVPYNWAGSTNQRVLRKESNFTVNTSDFIYKAMESVKASVKFAIPSIKDPVYQAADHVSMVAQNLELSDKPVIDLIREMDVLVPMHTDSEIREDFEDALKDAVNVALTREKEKEISYNIEKDLAPYYNKKFLTEESVADLSKLENQYHEKYDLSEERFLNFCKGFHIPFAGSLNKENDQVTIDVYEPEC